MVFSSSICKSLPFVGSLCRFCVDFRLQRSLAVFLPVLSKDARQESANPLLIELVLRVLAGRNGFRQRRTSGENTQVGDGTNCTPVHPAPSTVGTQSVDTNPNGLLSGKVGVAGKLPQPTSVETSVQLRARVARLRFGGALVCGFGLMEIPLLLVGNKFNSDESDKSATDCDFHSRHRRVDAGREEEKIGRCRDREKKDLVTLSARKAMCGQEEELTLCMEDVKKMFNKKNAGAPI